ncbi:lipase family protein [Nocardia sp. NEAU-G5]|uniref:Lipase family protein n=1 Tax=Nocardia albiluteola TaxID=2842303 RepID=A0ABS6AV38_9NOCA|nr:lipase family protein [Nocardia albiluteola]
MVVVSCCSLAATANAQPPASNPPAPPVIPLPRSLSVPDLQQWIDTVVPRPALPEAPATPHPGDTAPRSGNVAPQSSGAATDAAALRLAVLPDNVGDPLFDNPPANLAQLTPGRVVTTRDVTATAAPLLTVPLQRVLQLKFRTTGAHGEPSYATASLVLPATPWTGPGDRPLLVNNLAIDGLGRQCNPGYTLAHGYSANTNSADFFPPLTQLAALRGYAVLIPDHEGPDMAYAEPYVAAHAVLDSIRAVRNLMPAELGASRFAMTGYSGGAIATRAAAVLLRSYAPELAGSAAGAAMGGVPADYRMLSTTMNGNLASGVFMGAVFGIGREHPEILATMNNLAQQVATSPLKDSCMTVVGLPGLLQPSIDIAANIADPLHSAVARRTFRETDLSALKSAMPLMIYNGAQEFWIPAAGARELYRQQCALGVPGIYRDVPGEHFIAGDTGWGLLVAWLDERLQGKPAPDEC